MNEKEKRPEVADTTPAHDTDTAKELTDMILAFVGDPSNYTILARDGKVNAEALNNLAHMAIIRSMVSSYVATMQRLIGDVVPIGTEVIAPCEAVLAVRERASRELIAAARLHAAADADPDLWTWLHDHEYLQTRQERAGVESRTNIALDTYDVKGGTRS